MAEDNKDMVKQPAATPAGTERTRARRVFVPRVDIYETSEAIVLLADMPGVDETGVDITLEKNVLTLVGQIANEDRPGYSLAYAEYDAGDYERAFTISDEVDRDRIEATVKNGVLRVVLYKAEAVKARKIAIKAA
jgi:HSP20 family molecular chaperone IbpA